eukprot:3940685-Rhodomonas_salina.5
MQPTMVFENSTKLDQLSYEDRYKLSVLADPIVDGIRNMLHITACSPLDAQCDTGIEFPFQAQAGLQVLQNKIERTTGLIGSKVEGIHSGFRGYMIVCKKVGGRKYIAMTAIRRQGTQVYDCLFFAGRVTELETDTETDTEHRPCTICCKPRFIKEH